MFGTLAPRGALKITRLNGGPGVLWHLSNRSRPSYWFGWLAVMLAKAFTKFTGIPTMTSELVLLNHRKQDGRIINYGVVNYRVITDAGVAALVNDWYDGSKEIGNFKYHGIGTGNTAEAAADTALVTESTTALNPDNTRATGTQTKPTTSSLRSTATVVADAAIAMTEQGLFDQAATGGGVLFDRNVFSVVNIASGESVQSQHTITINSGG